MLLVDAPRRGQRHLERRDLVAELVDGLVPAGAGEAEASDVQGDLTGAKHCNRTRYTEHASVGRPRRAGTVGPCVMGPG